MNQKQRKTLLRIGLCALAFAAALMIPAGGSLRLAIFLVPYLIIAYDVLYRAGRNILRAQVFDENFLMSIASAGAFCLGDYPEAVAVMLFYQVGELFQAYAVERSRASIADLMDIRPDYANIEADGVLCAVDPERIGVGDIIVVKPGERIPLDGIVIEGAGSIDTAALTGESLPRNVMVGDALLSGCINQSGLLRVRVTKRFGESTVAKILDLVENASAKKANAEQFITRFARWYTPVVVCAAVLLAVVPPLLFAREWGEWVERALIFLVISCPCALVISVPLSFFGGIGGASRAGILVKGGNYLEALARTDVVIFDKTGTLTRGTFQVTEIHPDTLPKPRLLELAAHAESYSGHPIALSLRDAYALPIDGSRVTDMKEIAGQGVVATVDGHVVHAGNGRLMDTIAVRPRSLDRPGTIVHIAVDGVYAGYILICDEIKPDAKRAIIDLRASGVRRVIMLTGDSGSAANHVAAALGIDEVHAELLPGDKVEAVEGLLLKHAGKARLAFVGDGINDAPVLARSDVGIAMGSLGSDAAIEAADVVLMDDNPSKVALAMRIARKTLRIVKQNILFALAVKAIFLALGALGVSTMWEAVFADVGVSVIAILNAMRALKVREG